MTFKGYSGFVLSWEYSDGSGGQQAFARYEDARDELDNFDEDARVWIDAEQVQRGFIASDERAEDFEEWEGL